MSPAARRVVLVDAPPTAEQLAHAERLQAEGYEVELVPTRPGESLDFATAYTLAMQQRIDQTRAQLRPNPGPGRPTYPAAKE